MDYIGIILLGAIWGSFANVCIYRLPRNQNVITGRSKCPKCKKKILWHDNIPLLSFIYLQDKCRKCKKKIGFQYFAVELISIISFVSLYYYVGANLSTLYLIILSLIFIMIFFIDLNHYIIPDILSFSLMIIGFFKSFDPNLNTNLFSNYINSIIGGIFGYMVIWSIIYFYKQIRKKEGMGLGDAKLMSGIGFWFGWVSIPFIIFIASVIALIFVAPSVIKKTRKMSSQVPFGPFIIIATLIYVHFAVQIKLLLLI